MNDADRDPWRAARDHTDLCRVAERFLSGDLDHFPGWGAPDLDEESDELRELLLDCARSGWLTTASQPGRPFGPGFDGRTWGQRAFVCGFVRASLAARLGAALSRAGLWFFGPDAAEAPPAIPVGLRDGSPYLFAGHAAGPEELELFRDDLSVEALRALSQSRFVWAVDPVWGRREHLPAVLGTRLGTRLGPNETAPPRDRLSSLPANSAPHRP